MKWIAVQLWGVWVPDLVDDSCSAPHLWAMFKPLFPPVSLLNETCRHWGTEAQSCTTDLMETLCYILFLLLERNTRLKWCLFLYGPSLGTHAALTYSGAKKYTFELYIISEMTNWCEVILVITGSLFTAPRCHDRTGLSISCSIADESSEQRLKDRDIDWRKTPGQKGRISLLVI